MFWKVASYSDPSPIEAILDKDDFTLEDLLNQDDIIQECKSLNGRLVALYLVCPTDAVDEDTEHGKKQYKYSYTACELFCCDVESLFNTLVEDADLMQLLFSLLDGPDPLNCMLAGYFGRVVGMLLLRKTTEMSQYVQEHSQILERLVQHIGMTSIQEIILKLVGADETVNATLPPEHVRWVAMSTDLTDQLLARFQRGDSPPEARSNAGEVLAAIAHSQPSPLASKMGQAAFLESLFSSALAADSVQHLVPALSVCIALIDPQNLPQDGFPLGAGGAEGLQAAPLPTQPDADIKLRAVQGALAHLPDLVASLALGAGSDAGPQLPQLTPFGLLAPPLGMSRLKVVQLLSALAGTGEPSALLAIKQSGAIPEAWRLFRAYPFNNLLHHHVTALLTSVLLHGEKVPTVLEYLFAEFDLVGRMMKVPEDHPAADEGLPESADGQAIPQATLPQKRVRAGFHGHLTMLANAISDMLTRNDSLRQLLEARGDFDQFWATTIKDRNSLQDLKGWECGLPSNTEFGDASDELGNIGPPDSYHRYDPGARDDDVLHYDQQEEVEDEDGEEDEDEDEEKFSSSDEDDAQEDDDAVQELCVPEEVVKGMLTGFSLSIANEDDDDEVVIDDDAEALSPPAHMPMDAGLETELLEPAMPLPSGSVAHASQHATPTAPSPMLAASLAGSPLSRSVSPYLPPAARRQAQAVDAATLPPGAKPDTAAAADLKAFNTHSYWKSDSAFSFSIP